MAHCVNRSSQEFKALAEQSNINPIILAAKVSLWQEENGLDNFPAISDISNVKSGVGKLFESNPELSNVGTQEQYSAYLDSIFPDSQLKDIVYHGTHTKFNKFDKSLVGSKTRADIKGKGFFFSNSSAIAQGYKQSLDKSNVYNDVLFYYYFKKDLGSNNINTITQQDFQNIVLNYFGRENLNVQYLEKQSLEKTKALFEKFKNDTQFDTVEYDDELNFSEYIKDDSTLYSVILDSKNPLIVEGNNYQMLSIVKKEIEKLNDSNDSIIFNNVEDGISGGYRGVANTYTVFEPEQIHILGNKQDIEGFKNFVGTGNVMLQTEEMPASKSSPRTIEIIKNAARQMGISIQSLEDYLKGNPDVQTKGINGLADLIKGTVAIAQGMEDYALTEEVVHVATAILEQTNPKLVTEMISKIGRFKIYDETLKAYKGKKAYQLSNGKPDIRKIKKKLLINL